MWDIIKLAVLILYISFIDCVKQTPLPIKLF